MDTNLRESKLEKKPSVSTTGNIIKEVNNDFLLLTKYSKDEIVNQDIYHVFKNLLRLTFDTYEQINFKDNKRCYIFTKFLEAREVTISFRKVKDTGNKVYTFEEMPGSRIEDKLIFVEQMFIDNNKGAAVYSVPGSILLKANQKYLDAFGPPFDKMENCIGRPINEFFLGFVGSPAEAAWNTVLETGRANCMKELVYDKYESGMTYWDAVKTPIFEYGKLKYIFEVMEEVTERVLCKKLFEDQTKELKSRFAEYGSSDVEIVHTSKDGRKIKVFCKLDILKNSDGDFTGLVGIMRDITERNKIETELKSKNELLEAVIENMSDSLFIMDNKGVNIKINKAAKAMHKAVEYTLKVEDFFKAARFIDLEGNEISDTCMPFNLVCNGVKVINQRYELKYPNNSVFVSVNGIPIFDASGNLTCGIICFRDITESIQNQRLNEKHHAQLLQIEKEKNEYLKKAIEMKDEFLSTISHEFKTPLTVINSAIQAIELICKNELSDKAKGFLNKIRQNSDRQLKLVNNLLDITRINAGHIKINRKDMDIVLLTKSITESISIFAEQKGIRLIFSSTLKKKIIGVDEEKYERILLNLLSNAVKFTGVGKSISVKVSLKIVNRKCKVSIKIIDKGVGIPFDKQELIFKRFGQVDSSLTRQAEGTGIGLYLVKMLTERMDGEIILESKVGVGSTFTVLLPMEKAKETPIEQMINEINDNRLIQATAIEFSDVYL